ncbi:hypothetical protein ACFXOI_09900 [Streptomyces bacillaris]|uniref:hypothetical protein n=1 Tax=Streptomyces bacillaris TaxID=68179 RepID=UPI00369566EC
MPSHSRKGELDAARIVERVTGRVLTPYDRCDECDGFHDMSTPANGRYDFHQGQDGALEVTLATSGVAERNEQQWSPYISPHPAPALSRSWHVVVDSRARAKALRGKKGARDSKELLETVGSPLPSWNDAVPLTSPLAVPAPPHPSMIRLVRTAC